MIPLRISVSIVIATICVSGCAGVGRPGKGVDSAGRKVYLSDAVSHQKRLEHFLYECPHPTEYDKTQYLLHAIGESKDKFIRSGIKYSGEQAMEWLRWKKRHPQFEKEPVRTAKDFVERVADISLASGIPYEVVFPDGTRHELKSVMENELEALEGHVEKLRKEEESRKLAELAEKQKQEHEASKLSIDDTGLPEIYEGESHPAPEEMSETSEESVHEI